MVRDSKGKLIERTFGDEVTSDERLMNSAPVDEETGVVSVVEEGRAVTFDVRSGKLTAIEPATETTTEGIKIGFAEMREKRRKGGMVERCMALTACLRARTHKSKGSAEMRFL